MSKMTIYKLAKELNMTPSMISRAFSPSGKVSEEKKKLILETAKKYDFVPNKMASRLSMRSIRIGIIINSSFTINAEKMIKGIEMAYNGLKDYKITYDVSLIDLSKTPDFDYASVFDSYADCDGIIVAGFSADKYTEELGNLYLKNQNLVQVQAINEGTDYLFASKHDEKIASEVAAEFLYNCLKRSDSKNILLFIGDEESLLHKRAKEAFYNACTALGLNVLETVSTKGSEEKLKNATMTMLDKYGESIDGIYCTSGFSYPICECLQKRGSDVAFVAFDTHSEIKSYMEKNVISATISQDICAQMQNAFEHLVMHIINGAVPNKTIYTDVQLVLKSNMHLFD